MALQRLFHCPNCNAALDLEEKNAAIVRCDYCHSVVIVPEALRQREGGAAAETSQPEKPLPLKPAKPQLTEEESRTKVVEMARNGRKIEAMKLYRESYPVGLQEAKEAIERAATGLPLPIPEVRWEDEADLPLEAAEEITHLAALGRLEEAAHLYRVTFGTSHAEADAAVAQLVEGKSIDIARHRAREETQATAVRRERTEPVQKGGSQTMVMGIAFFTLLFLGVLAALLLLFVF